MDKDAPEFKERTVAVALDRVGYMVRHHLLPDTVFTELLKGMIEELWTRRLKDTVDEVRKDRPGYCHSLEWLINEKLPKIKAGKQEGI